MSTSEIIAAFASKLDAEGRDVLRDLAEKEARRSGVPDKRQFWEGVVQACRHPKPVTGEA